MTSITFQQKEQTGCVEKMVSKEQYDELLLEHNRMWRAIGDHHAEVGDIAEFALGDNPNQWTKFLETKDEVKMTIHSESDSDEENSDDERVDTIQELRKKLDMMTALFEDMAEQREYLYDNIVEGSLDLEDVDPKSIWADPYMPQGLKIHHIGVILDNSDEAMEITGTKIDNTIGHAQLSISHDRPLVWTVINSPTPHLTIIDHDPECCPSCIILEDHVLIYQKARYPVGTEKEDGLTVQAIDASVWRMIGKNMIEWDVIDKKFFGW